MKNLSLYEEFSFLLLSNRFYDCIEEKGMCYRQVLFRSVNFNLRIAEQDENTGVSVTCLAFVVDPANQYRWCMFERAVELLLGRKINGSENRSQLAQNIHDNIDALLALVECGKVPPYEDFSRFK